MLRKRREQGLAGDLPALMRLCISAGQAEFDAFLSHLPGENSIRDLMQAHVELVVFDQVLRRGLAQVLGELMENCGLVRAAAGGGVAASSLQHQAGERPAENLLGQGKPLIVARYRPDNGNSVQIRDSFFQVVAADLSERPCFPASAEVHLIVAKNRRRSLEPPFDIALKVELPGFERARRSAFLRSLEGINGPDARQRVANEDAGENFAAPNARRRRSGLMADNGLNAGVPGRELPQIARRDETAWRGSVVRCKAIAQSLLQGPFKGTAGIFEDVVMDQ